MKKKKLCKRDPETVPLFWTLTYLKLTDVKIKTVLWSNSKYVKFILKINDTASMSRETQFKIQYQ